MFEKKSQEWKNEILVMVLSSVESGDTPNVSPPTTDTTPAPPPLSKVLNSILPETNYDFYFCFRRNTWIDINRDSESDYCVCDCPP